MISVSALLLVLFVSHVPEGYRLTSSRSPTSSSPPPFVRLLPLGLLRVTEHYAEELLETIWRGIGPAAPEDPGA
jgi:hypothetical protein